MSHPMWVRGLKQMDVAHRRNLHQVAPYVGAWIETVFVRWGTSSRQSHPMWVRGLKLQPDNEHVGVEQVAPYVGAWIETTSTTF